MFESVLPQAAQAALAVLGKSGVVKDAYLAGGSALALQFGHRQSVDFDFFSPHMFDLDKLIAALKAIGPFTSSFAKGKSLIGDFSGVKMSYFYYQYPLITKTSTYANVAIAHPHEIAAMKLVAIMDRSTKKDFVDLYTLAHRGVSLERMFELYDQKYHVLSENVYSIIRALQYFDEIEASDMPEMLIPLRWGEVKQFFVAESIRLGRKYLEE